MIVRERLGCTCFGRDVVARRDRSRLSRGIGRLQLDYPRHEKPRTDEDEGEPRHGREDMRDAHDREGGQSRQDESLGSDPPRTPLAEKV